MEAGRKPGQPGNMIRRKWKQTGSQASQARISREWKKTSSQASRAKG